MGNNIKELYGLLLAPLARYRLILVFGVLCVFSLLEVYDNDTLLHLSLGRLIFETQGIPGFEVFSYPSHDRPFSYTSWLFGFCLYLVHELGGGIALSLLKAFLILLLMYVLWRDAVGGTKNNSNIALITTILAYLLLQQRFALRPEMPSVILLAVSVWLLNLFWYQGKRGALFFLPPIACLWANIHSSIPLGFLIFGAFIVGGLLQQIASRRYAFIQAGSKNRVRDITLAGIASLLASLISPYGLEQYIHAFQYHDTLWYAHKIFELQPVSGTGLYVHWTVIILTLFSFFLNRRHLSLVHLLLVIPPLLMPFQANRYLLYAVVISAPIIARNLAQAVEFTDFKPQPAGPFQTTSLFVVLIFTLALIGIPSSPFRQAADRGLGLQQYHPTRLAIEFLLNHDITGRILNGFNDGNYAIWRGYPKLTVFVDSRGYVSKELLEDATKFENHSEITERLFEEYGFQTIIIRNPWGGIGGNTDLRRYTDRYRGISNEKWALVFWDDNMLVYLRRGDRFEKTIVKTDYQHAVPDLNLATFINSLAGREDIGLLQGELERTIKETNSLYARALLSLSHNTYGNYKATIDLLSPIDAQLEGVNEPNRRRFFYELLADAYRMTSQSSKAIDLYRRALGNSEDNLVHLKLARSLVLEGQTKQAVHHLQRSIALNQEVVAAYHELIRAHRLLGDDASAERVEARLAQIQDKNRLQQLFREGTSAYLKKDYAKAELIFNRLLARGTDAATLINLGYVYLDTSRPREAKSAFINAARISPDAHEAHYGLALVAEKEGDVGEQVINLKKYIANAPKGYFYRRAVETLNKLEKSL